jgi:hypothetical protein
MIKTLHFIFRRGRVSRKGLGVSLINAESRAGDSAETKICFSYLSII